MPPPRNLIRSTYNWYGAENITRDLQYQFEQFQFEGVGPWYRPLSAEGWVFTTSGRPRAELLAFPDLHPNGYFATSNPTFSIGGHLIAVSLAGIDEPENIVPVSKRTNDEQQRVENEIKTLANNPLYLVIQIPAYHPADRDPRVPARFVYRLYNRPGGNQLREWTITQDWMTVGPVGLSPENINGFRTGAQFVQTSGWLIENITNSAAGGRDLTFLRGHLPSPGNRPYAVLDYMLIEKKGGGLCSEQEAASYVQSIALGSGFTGFARNLALLGNAMRHGDFLHSDVWGRPETYLETKTAGVTLETHTNLINGGGGNAPQLDHIVPEALNGANCLSNGQITSMSYNASKGKNMQQLVLHDDQWKANMTAQLVNQHLL